MSAEGRIKSVLDQIRSITPANNNVIFKLSISVVATEKLVSQVETRGLCFFYHRHFDVSLKLERCRKPERSRYVWYGFLLGLFVFFHI